VVNGTNGNETTVDECSIVVDENGTEVKPVVDEVLPEINDGTDVCITDTDPSS
jgi:hypothetical protein